MKHALARLTEFSFSKAFFLFRLSRFICAVAVGSHGREERGEKMRLKRNGFQSGRRLRRRHLPS